MAGFQSLLQKVGQQKEVYLFQFVEGKYQGGEFVVPRNGQLIVGRDVSCDVAIIDPKVSRKHARIWNGDGVTYIEDSNSTNGSLLNGKLLKAGTPHKLSPGDKVTIGDSVFLYRGLESEAKKNEKPVPVAQQAVAEAPKKEPSAASSVPKNEVPVREAPVTTTKNAPDIDSVLEGLEAVAADTPPRGISIGKISVEKRDLKAALAQTRFDGALHAKEGKLSKIDPVDLVNFFLQSNTVGILQVKITAPFCEKVEIRFGEKGITGASSLTNKVFVEEKVFSRLLLAKDGEYSLKASEEPRNENMHQAIFDLFMEIQSQKPLLVRYRKIVAANSLRFQIPMTGKLSALGKKELDSLQFMVNAVETQNYLNLFPEHDDFILLSEVLKYIDMGILFGDNNEEHTPGVPRDIMEL